MNQTNFHFSLSISVSIIVNYGGAVSKLCRHFVALQQTKNKIYKKGISYKSWVSALNMQNRSLSRMQQELFPTMFFTCAGTSCHINNPGWHSLYSFTPG